MKKYKLLKDLPTFKAGSIYEYDGSGSYIYILEGAKRDRWSADIVENTPDWFESIEDKVDWKRIYKDVVAYGDPRFDAKREAYLKILCYVEAANEGKELKDKYYEVAVDGANRLDVCEYTMVCTNGLVVLTDKADAEAMLEDPELVEALEIIYNIKREYS